MGFKSKLEIFGNWALARSRLLDQKNVKFTIDPFETNLSSGSFMKCSYVMQG